MILAYAIGPIQTPAGPLTLRPEGAADEAFLYTLFRSTRAADLPVLPGGATEALLQMQFRAMRDGYRREFPQARYAIAELEERAIGRLVTDLGADEVRYVDIAVRPSEQRRGIAAALMRAVLEEPRRLGVPARVQVLASNAASLGLCARLGFRVVAEQPPFFELEWRSDAQ